MSTKTIQILGSISKSADDIGAVSYDTAQTLTEEQQTQARENIGAQGKLIKPSGKSYLTFSSPSTFTLAVNDATKHWDGTLEYFAEDKTWTTWDGTTTLSSINNDGEHVLYLRGIGNTKITGSKNYRWRFVGTDIACVGNIENLLDYATVEAGNHPTMSSYCYAYMFYDCLSLTQAPVLPAISLAEACYNAMFYGCLSLTKAPALPATTLAYNCYQIMFQGCTGLTQAPALPATTLEQYCYQAMFYGCISITQAPDLHATTLATGCYYNMFYGCTSLTQAPELPATTLANACYAGMFNGCTSLIQAPTLHATTLSALCYNGMFSGCTSLKLSSTKTGEYIQEYRIPMSGTGITATNALNDMFTGTDGTFTGTPEINTTYYLSTDNMVVRETEIATLNGYVGSMIDAKSNASSIIEQNKGLSQKFWRGTTAEYEALTEKSDDTMYIITDTEELAQTTYMPMNIYDPQGKAQDIFAYIDAQVNNTVGVALEGSY